MSAASATPRPEHDPVHPIESDAWIADLIRENEELKKEVARVDKRTDAGLPVTTASDVAPDSAVPHSPLPWDMREANRDYPAYITAPDESDVAVLYGSNDDMANADAAFIVRACNNFDALLTAAKEIASFAQSWQPLTPGDIRALTDAIAKAEGR